MMEFEHLPQVESYEFKQNYVSQTKAQQAAMICICSRAQARIKKKEKVKVLYPICVLPMPGTPPIK